MLQLCHFEKLSCTSASPGTFKNDQVMKG